ncbi:MAG: hypothetical protein HY897_04775 [Deltaproteobacteria bacterium]|nr:hypothetical protein [Deltaproteobacteria bacterium]
MSVNPPGETPLPPAEHCVNHPARPARLRCTKYSKPLCDMCVACQDPALYCKFRTECLVWEIERQKKKDEGR